MQKLTKAQIGHLENRTRHIVTNIMIESKAWGKYLEKKLTAQEKVALILKGKAELDKKKVKAKGASTFLSFVDFFIFKETAEIDKHNDRIQEKRKKLNVKLNEKQSELVDTIVLKGINDLGVVKTFEKECKAMLKK